MSDLPNTQLGPFTVQAICDALSWFLEFPDITVQVGNSRHDEGSLFPAVPEPETTRLTVKYYTDGRNARLVVSNEAREIDVKASGNGVLQAAVEIAGIRAWIDVAEGTQAYCYLLTQI